ncbi:MAG: hypothetical protein PHS55_07995 [Firmicutes bacterium]|nr:hypothetical protein [Bacillota bacterium]
MLRRGRAITLVCLCIMSVGVLWGSPVHGGEMLASTTYFQHGKRFRVDSATGTDWEVVLTVYRIELNGQPRKLWSYTGGHIEFEMARDVDGDGFVEVLAMVYDGNACARPILFYVDRNEKVQQIPIDLGKMYEDPNEMFVARVSSFMDLDGDGVDELIAWVPQYWMPYLTDVDTPYASIVCKAKGKRYVPAAGEYAPVYRFLISELRGELLTYGSHVLKPDVGPYLQNCCMLLLYRSLVGEMEQGIQEFDALTASALEAVDMTADRWFADRWRDFTKNRVALLTQANKDFGGIPQKR